MTDLAMELVRINVLIDLWRWLHRSQHKAPQHHGPESKHEVTDVQALPKLRPRPDSTDREQVERYRAELNALRRMRALQRGTSENRAALDQYLAEAGLVYPGEE